MATVRSCVRLRPDDSPSSAFVIEANRLSVQREVLAAEGRADWLADSSFAFHDVFSADACTEEVYKHAAADVLPNAVLRGIHCTLLAYGQTSSGKTYTMLGDAAAATSSSDVECPGLITLAVEDVLRRVGESNGARRYRLKLSCLEVYNEQVNDLLAPERTHLKLYEKAGGIVVHGLSE